MSNTLRQSLLLLVLLLIFAGSLVFAWTLTGQHSSFPAPHISPLAWYVKYPGAFKPLDIPHAAWPVNPNNAMIETLPDGSVRYLYIFRLITPASLPDASEELFEKFNRVRPQKGAAAHMAGQDAIDLSLITGDAFIVQRSVLIQGNLFAVTLVGNSELSDDDVALFDQFCDSVTVRREKVN